MRRATSVLGTAFVTLSAVAFVSTMNAGATASHPLHKVTICHATNSISNPYVQITVDEAAVDGQEGNDHGRGDHLLTHGGPVFDAANPVPGWGDMIPPFYSDPNETPTGYPSLNWEDNPAGQDLFYNGCNVSSEGGEG